MIPGAASVPVGGVYVGVPNEECNSTNTNGNVIAIHQAANIHHLQNVGMKLHVQMCKAMMHTFFIQASCHGHP